MSDMSIIKFILYTLFGSLIWNTALIFVGAFAGDKKDLIIDFIDKASIITLILLVAIFGGFIIWFYKNKLRKK